MNVQRPARGGAFSGAAVSAQTLIGREAAIGQLVDTVKAVAAGSSALRIITGEAGIGKTRLMDDALEHARLMECRVLRVRAHEYDAGTGFSTLRDLLLSGHDTDLPAAAASTASQLSEMLGAAATGQVLQQAPHELMTRMVQEICAIGPCVIAVDDAHLADEETLTALSLVARFLRRERLLFLGTIRADQWTSNSSFAATVGRSTDEQFDAVIELRPLNQTDIEIMAMSILGQRPDDLLTAYLFQQGRGNPLYTRETIHALREQGSLRTEHGRCYLAGEPALGLVTRRGALIHRVFQQDRYSRDVARHISAFGRFHIAYLPQLASILSMAEDDVRRAFDRLTDASILQQSAGGWYEFAHPLIAEVLYDDLGPAERRRLHRAIATLLQDTTVGPSQNADWATHVVEAAEPGDRDAVAVALDSARTARRVAPLAAARWFQWALDLLDPADERRAEILSRQCTAYWKGSRPDRAISTGTAALTDLAPGPALSRTLGTVVNALYSTGRLNDALTMLDRWSDRVDDPAVTHAQRGLLLAQLGRTDEAQRHSELGLTHLRNSRAENRAVVCSHLGHTQNLIGTYAALRHTVSLLADTIPVDLPSGQLSALESAAYLLSSARMLAETTDLLHRTDVLSKEAGWHDIGGQNVRTRATAQFLAGEWNDALDTIRSGAVRLEFSGLITNLASLRITEAELLFHRGDTAEAARVLDSAPIAPEWVLMCTVRDLLKARIDLARGRRDEALTTVNTILVEAHRAQWTDVTLGALDALALAAIDDGDQTRAGQHVETMKDLARLSGFPSAAQSVALTESIVTGSSATTQQVLHVAELDGQWFLAGRARLTLAATGVDPAANLAIAKATFEAMGAAAWTQRVHSEARRQEISLVRTPSISGSDISLSATEIQLGRMVRDGLSNRQIADALHYSRKTVEAYLSRLYRKLSCRSRVDLVVALERDPALLQQLSEN